MQQIFVEHVIDISGICDIYMREIFVENVTLVEHATDICGTSDIY